MMKLVALYDPATGEVAQTSMLTLPLGVAWETATDEQWQQAKDDLEAAAGMPSIYGVAQADQIVRDGVLVQRPPKPPAP